MVSDCEGAPNWALWRRREDSRPTGALFNSVGFCRVAEPKPPGLGDLNDCEILGIMGSVGFLRPTPSGYRALSVTSFSDVRAEPS